MYLDTILLNCCQLLSYLQLAPHNEKKPSLFVLGDPITRLHPHKQHFVLLMKCSLIHDAELVAGAVRAEPMGLVSKADDV